MSTPAELLPYPLTQIVTQVRLNCSPSQGQNKVTHYTSLTVSPPPTGGIGVRVLPASRVLVPKCDACAFLARQEKPKTQPASHAAKKESSIIRSAQHIKPRISAPQIP